MPHDPLTTLLHVGDAFAPLLRHGPAFVARLTDASWSVAAGQSNSIWNWVGLTSASPANRATLRDAVGRLRARRHEGLVCYPADAGTALAETFRDLGLGDPHEVPLLTCDPGDVPPLAATDVAVARVADPDTLAATLAVMATAFEVPTEQARRGLPAAVLAEPAVAFYAARRGGPVAGMLALTRFGGAVLIDLMAVEPAAQRGGIGRALMLAAMHDQLAAGATAFHLLSSGAGRRLYHQVGFTTLLPTLLRDIPVDPIPPDRVVT